MNWRLASRLSVITLAALVVLTFIATHSPSESAALADKLAEVLQRLGQQSQQVAVLAVSVDPHGDTVASVTQFSQAHHLLTSWHYLLGTQAELAPVWKAYAIGVSAAPTAQVSTSGPVVYTSAIYVIDQQGRERVYLDDSFTPAQLTTDLQKLLKG